MEDFGMIAGIVLFGGLAVYYSLYFLIKKATKDAIKEYFQENGRYN